MLISLLDIATAAKALRAAGVLRIDYRGDNGSVLLELAPDLAQVAAEEIALEEPREEFESAIDLCAAVTAEEDRVA